MGTSVYTAPMRACLSRGARTRPRCNHVRAELCRAVLCTQVVRDAGGSDALLQAVRELTDVTRGVQQEMRSMALAAALPAARPRCAALISS